MRILIAEDERITRASLARHLQSWGHTVATAEDGDKALALFRADPPDIVLTDWEMPGLSGPELVQRIREEQARGFVYIVMLTGRTDKSDVVRGIEAGADDFLSKPFDKEELRVRLLAGERIVRLERALGLQNQELRAAGERMRADLRAAARVQRAMLPRSVIATPRVRTEWRYAPTDELAGDGIGLHLIDDRYLIAYVFDVSGHGVPAALLSVSVTHAVSPVPAETSMVRCAPGGSMGSVRAPHLVADELNRRFPSENNDGHFITLGLYVLDTFTGRVEAVRAGHPLPFHIRGGIPVTVDDEGGLPLGVCEGIPYELSGMQLQPGDRLCIVSDGLTEQIGGPGPSPRQFGEDRIAEVLARPGELPVVGDAMITALERWADSRTFNDDVSLVLIEWLGPP